MTDPSGGVVKTLFPDPATDLPGYPAAWSPCRSFRYTLWRRWGAGSRFVQFIGLNPSTADEQRNDPTVTRCIGFAKRWDYDGMCMTNLFAFRATDPAVMKAAADPAGPENDRWLWHVADKAALRIACWGQHGRHLGRDRYVHMILGPFQLHCIGRNKNGQPSHPLMLPSGLEPREFPAPELCEVYGPIPLPATCPLPPPQEMTDG